jgi:DNA polymerase III subunit delta'
MLFEDISGQDAAIGILRRAITTDKVSHAYLFSGPPGVGKHRTARGMAMALNCVESVDSACGNCLSCRKIQRDIHPDVFTVTLPTKKKSIPIDSIRDLERRLAIRAHEGKAKVAIVDPADLMTEPAANALLKTLEEPRAGSFIILVTSKYSSLLPTVRSRCQLVRYKPLLEDIVSGLLTAQGVPESESIVIAAMCGGSMDQASAFLDGALDRRLDLVFELIRCLPEPTPVRGLDVAQILKSSRETTRDETLAVLDLLTVMLGESLWLTTHGNESSAQHTLARKYHDELMPLAQFARPERIAEFVATVHHAQQGIIRNNMNPQLALEGMLVSMRGRGKIAQFEIGQ